MVMRRAFHAGSTGSNPVRGTSCKSQGFRGSRRRGRAHTSPTIWIAALLLSALAGASWLLISATSAASSEDRAAPVKTCQTYAAARATIAGERSAPTYRRDLKQCSTAVIATERCLAVPGSDMGPIVCEGLARAALELKLTAWAWNPSLHELLRRESTWNPNAVNDASGACGLFQILQMMPPAKQPCPWKVTDPTGRREQVHTTALIQARRGLRYILNRPGYGTPAKALAFHDANGWY